MHDLVTLDLIQALTVTLELSLFLYLHTTLPTLPSVPRLKLSCCCSNYTIQNLRTASPLHCSFPWTPISLCLGTKCLLGT